MSILNTEPVPAATETSSWVLTTVSILPESIQQVYQKLLDSLSPDFQARASKRLERGLQIALEGKVTFTSDPHIFIVAGTSHPSYTVNLSDRTCDCPDCSMIPANYCKHRIAAYLVREAANCLPLEAIEPPEPVELADIEPFEEDDPSEVLEVTDISIFKLRFRGVTVSVELVRTNDGQVSARALLPDAAPLFFNTSSRQAVAECLATYL